MKSVLKAILCKNCRELIEEHDSICTNCGFDFVRERQLKTRCQSEQSKKGRFHVFCSLILLSLTHLAEYLFL
jgi:predicted amidophosphoribosyltransferase